MHKRARIPFLLISGMLAFALNMFPRITRADTSVPIEFETNILLLLQRLTDRDAMVRVEAASHLTRLHDSRATEPLILLLKDQDKKIRLDAIKALEHLQDIRAQQPLILLLSEKDFDIRLAAIRALGEIGDVGAAETLITILHDDPDARMREQAVHALGHVDDARAVEPLIEALNDPDVKVWYYAGQVLANLGDHRAAQPLIDLVGRGRYINEPDEVAKLTSILTAKDMILLRPLLDNKDKLVQLKGAQLLAWLGDEVALNLLLAELHKGGEYEAFAISALEGSKDPRIVEPLIKLLQAEDALENFDHSWRAITTLTKIDNPRVIDALIALVNKGTGESQVPEIAADALGKLKAKGAVDALIALLKSNSAQTRSVVAIALANIGDARAIPPIKNLALTDPESSVRSTAVQALSRLGDYSLLDTVLAKLKSTKSEERHEALYSFTNANNPRVTQAIISTIRQSMGYERFSAALVLCSQKDVKAMEALADLLTDQAFPGRIRLLHSLAYYARKDAAPEALPEKFTTQLCHSLKSTGHERMYAINALGAFKARSAVTPIIETLQDNHSRIRLAAVEALGEIGDPKAAAALRPLLKDDASYVRSVVAEVLGQFKDVEAIDPLITALMSEEATRVQNAIADALTRITGEKFGVDAEKWARWRKAQK